MQFSRVLQYLLYYKIINSLVFAIFTSALCMLLVQGSSNVFCTGTFTVCLAAEGSHLNDETF